MDDPETRSTRAWVEAWRERAKALDQIETEELRALTSEDAGRTFADMAADTDTFWISPEREGSAGLVEQQRLFMLCDEHPARHRRRP